jgi:hypothetical protein
LNEHRDTEGVGQFRRSRAGRATPTVNRRPLWIVAFLLIALAPPSLAATGDVSAEAATSMDALFGDNSKKDAEAGVKFNGFAQMELAYTIAAPAHWSRMLTRAEVDATGAFSPEVRWKLSGRVDYDAVYDLTRFYSPAVAHDARLNFLARENYVDISANDWDFRLGRQQIVWGEMVALFAADVVSAKDLREFILPDFNLIRIPQWATRAEYFKNDFHAEFIWVPVATYDEIGVPGSEFYPGLPPPPPGFAKVIRDERFPDRSFGHTNYGVRLSLLRAGWDLAGYYYGSMDQSPTFYRTVVTRPQPAFIYEPRHERIDQAGFTLSKDFGVALFKAETVYTSGRRYSVDDLSDVDGVVRQNTLDWVTGIEFGLPVLTDTRLNLQAVQRIYFNRDPHLIAKEYETGYSAYATTQLGRGFEGTLLWASSLDRRDWMLRLGVARNFEKNWRLAVGLDLFDGVPLGLFGQYGNRDRVYAQVTYSF